MAATVRPTGNGLAIRIDVLGETQISRKMLRFASRATNNIPVFELIHGYLRDISERQFASAGASSGKPWEPLRSSTIQRKARSFDAKTKENADRILHATETLRNSLVNAGDANQIRTITPTVMVYGTKVSYGPFHMKPGPHDRAVRRPVDLTEKQKLVIVKTLQMWIARGQARLMGTP
jgi:hypothetical protein